MHFGTDPDCMTKFMEAGYAIRGDGGVFRFSMDMSQRISTIYIQVRDLSFINEMSYRVTWPA
jgi:hypothetical protein